MQNIYEAANAVEAHMLRDLLKQEGIAAHIHGEYLQGGMGELPAAGLVRLVVDEADVDRARALLTSWEQTQPAESAAITPKTSARQGRVRAGLVGLAMGMALTTVYFKAPARVDGFDHNHDGVLDEKWTDSLSRQPLKYEVDRNLDGKVDYISWFDKRGLVTASEADDDFNGSFESRSTYKYNQLASTETDSDGDGFPEFRQRYEHGVLTHIDIIQPNTGLPLRVERYRLGRLQSVDIDSNNDGVLDQRLYYSPTGQVSRSETTRP
ncbi:MAG: DUF2007 domain-containing protein [Rhizobacter sp.]